MTFDRSFAMSMSDLWGLIWRDGGRQRWLGDAVIDPEPGGSGSVPDWNGGAPATVDIMFTPAGPGPASRQLTLTAGAEVLQVLLTRVGPSTSVTIDTTTPLSATERAAWAARFDRLGVMVKAVRARRDRPRQAVIVIHGVGQQLPGTTIRALLKGDVLGRPQGTPPRVRPDRAGGLFDLRRWSFGPTSDRKSPFTDAYELYWADLMAGNTVGGALSWIRRLLLRRHVPYPLRPVWTAGWLVVVLGAIVAGLIASGLLPPWLASGSAVAFIALTGWKLLVAPTIAGFLGDAARYLSPGVEDVPVRQQIRESAVHLLDELHDSGRYDRIVVIGHSLGSVIAYDMLTFAWARYASAHRSPEVALGGPLTRVAARRGATRETGRALQQKAWRQAQRNTQPWLVTDLVTLGSPMTYGRFLMATTAEALEADQQIGVLPMCPPIVQRVPEQAANPQLRCTFERGYDVPASPLPPLTPDGAVPFKRARTITLFTGAAPFGPTRWTNLYFPVRLAGLKGDVIGGPLAPTFGDWIADMPVKSPVSGFAHGEYWRPGPSDSPHLVALRNAIGPDSMGELRSLLWEMPAYAVFDRVRRAGG